MVRSVKRMLSRQVDEVFASVCHLHPFSGSSLCAPRLFQLVATVESFQQANACFITGFKILLQC